MGAGLRLELRQSQQLVMTPQLQQAIKLLQMSNQELGSFVLEEVERNPLLTTDVPDMPDAADQPERVEAQTPRSEQGADARVTPEGDLSLVGETFDTGAAENLYDASGSDAPAAAGQGIDRGASRSEARAAPLEDAEGLEARLTRPVSLREHLTAQIGQARATVAERAVALALVEDLDEAGYLRADLGATAERLGIDDATAAAGLALLQQCDPTGVGARTLGECLGLQLAERNRLDPAMRAFLDNLALLGRGQVDRLRAHCGVDAEDLSDMIAEIRTLDPRPCAGFWVEDAETLVPDVHVRPARFGGWHVELNADTLPQVLIDRRYAADLARGGGETRAFLATCRENASWLIKSLDQRARTILKVSTEIVRQQEGFLDRGISGLRPLSLRMVADAIGMHESTVSRVTSNKYMATERGIFELKYFFTNAVGGGDGVSSEAVRDRVRALIAGERAEAVLSDDDVVAALGREGVEIARRTVAKYRKGLGIPSSVDRRRQRALHDAG